MSAWQPCGKRLRECIDDVCRHSGECAWPPLEWQRVEAGQYCPHLTCLVEGAHEHPVCPACGAVRFGNISCETCQELRGDDLNPHRRPEGRFDYLARADLPPPPEDWPPEPAPEITAKESGR